MDVGTRTKKKAFRHKAAERQRVIPEPFLPQPSYGFFNFDQMKRVGISKRVRFQIFSRDGFTCAYCGSKPPDVILEVDHINPVSKGGLNNEMNIITSCFDCNRGKSDRLITSNPNQVQINSDELKTKLEQMKMYQKHLSQMEVLKQEMIDLVEVKFTMYHPDRVFSDTFRESVFSFIKKLGVETVSDAMILACKKVNNPTGANKYFCAVCWNKIRGNEEGRI